MPHSFGVPVRSPTAWPRPASRPLPGLAFSLLSTVPGLHAPQPLPAFPGGILGDLAVKRWRPVSPRIFIVNTASCGFITDTPPAWHLLQLPSRMPDGSARSRRSLRLPPVLRPMMVLSQKLAIVRSPCLKDAGAGPHSDSRGVEATPSLLLCCRETTSRYPDESQSGYIPISINPQHFRSVST